MELRRILNASVDGMTLHLRFDDGETRDVDFAPLIARGGIYSELAESAFFRRFQISSDGRVLSWPDEIEFCADGLWAADGALQTAG